jgi:hypothetical protein
MILPPQVAKSWDEMSVWAQAQVLAYNQVREHDDAKWEALMAGMKVQ